MYKVVINCCYGGFGLSKEALELLAEKGVELKGGRLPHDFPRHDKRLVEVVEMLGEKADARFSELRVVEIDSPMYLISEYDGLESVDTPDSLDWVVIK